MTGIRAKPQARDILSRRPELCGAVVDVRLPDGDGLEIVAELRKASPTLPVLVTTGICTAEMAARVFELDARYVVKPYWAQQLVEFARQSVAGGFDPLSARLQAAAATLARQAGLTERDQEVLVAAALDDRREKMQLALGMELPTLKRHLERIFERTGAKDSRDLGARVRQLAVDWPRPPDA